MCGRDVRGSIEENEGVEMGKVRENYLIRDAFTLRQLHTERETRVSQNLISAHAVNMKNKKKRRLLFNSPNAAQSLARVPPPFRVRFSVFSFEIKSKENTHPRKEKKTERKRKKRTPT